ncbi:MAG: phospholipid carrier-dependent glycosyltransferase [Neisseriales bacterium]|nr:MAG: phospholipid carrier-dependent glycosyltransferase [Neisseriales bacterium]
MSTLAILQVSFLVILLATVTIWVLNYSSKNYKSSTSKSMGLNLTIKDLGLLLILCSIFGYISQINLGTKDIKKSVWQGNYPGKQIELKFPHKTELGKVYYYSGFTNGLLEIDAIKEDGVKAKLEIENQSESSHFLFMWITVNIPESVGKVSSIKFIVEKPLVSINQIFLMDNNNKPVTNFTIIGNVNSDYDSIISDFIPLNFKPSIQSINKDSTIWDEIYYATSAYQLVNYISPLYVREHPPLGINIIASSITLFGMSPFAWRLPAYITGVLLILIVYLFAKQIFERSVFAFLASLLISLDFMHFVFSRIAALDSILIVFTTATLLFFYRYFNHSQKENYSEGLKSLLTTGYLWGLALATKWSALFMIFIFIVLIIYSELGLYKDRTRLFFRLSLYLAAIIVLPICIYSLSYIPEFINSKETNFYQFVFEQILYAWYFQTDTMVHIKPHFYSSVWWSWPILKTPFAIFRNNDILHGLSTSIVLMGNPAIWWLGIGSCLILLVNYLVKRDKVSFFILLSIASMYLPYSLFKRSTFIYYFYFVTPLITLAIVKSIDILSVYSKRLIYALTIIYIIYAFGLFILFYPVLAGETVARSYIYNYLHWFSTWVF